MLPVLSVCLCVDENVVNWLPVPAPRLCHPFPLELKTKISLPHGPLKLFLVAVLFHNRKVTNVLGIEFIQYSNHFIDPLKSVRGFNH